MQIRNFIYFFICIEIILIKDRFQICSIHLFLFCRKE